MYCPHTTSACCDPCSIYDHFFFTRYPTYHVPLARAHVFIGLLFLRPSITAFGVQKSRSFPQLVKPKIETRQTIARDGFDFLFIIYTHSVLTSGYYLLRLFDKLINSTSLPSMPGNRLKIFKKNAKFYVAWRLYLITRFFLTHFSYFPDYTALFRSWPYALVHHTLLI